MSTASNVATLGNDAAKQALAKKGPPKDFPAMLDQWKGEIARALPRHLNADRMARIALTCFRAVPKLGECDPKSVFAAVIQAAQLGIEPGLMGEAHIIPYGSQAQLIPGYQGLIKLAKQTGQVIDIYAMAVREKDKFNTSYGLNRTLEHEPLKSKGGFPASDAERGDIVGFYAVAVFKDGTRTFVLMGRDKVDAIRDGSQGYKMAMKYKKDSPWISSYEEMGCKTVIRRLCKTLPKSPELAQALALEDAHGSGKAQNIDLHDAMSGGYTPPVSGDVMDVDPDTGDVIEQGASAPAEKPADGKKAEKPAPAGAPSIQDAINLVNAGDYDAATDMVKGTGFTDIDRVEVASCIKRHKAGEKV